MLPSALTNVGSIPGGRYDEPSMTQTMVPNRNMILLAIAAGYAEGIGAGYITYAAHSEDHYIYPDCRPEFIDSISETIRLATGNKITLLEPFTYKTKADIVTLGKELGAPLGLTWSCYKGGELHCGKCGTCQERRSAFIEAAIEDPTQYDRTMWTQIEQE